MTFGAIQGNSSPNAHPHGLLCCQTTELLPNKRWNIDTYSPKTIMSGQTINYKQRSLSFGTYCQVHKEDGPRNSLLARTSGAISVGPLSN